MKINLEETAAMVIDIQEKLVPAMKDANEYVSKAVTFANGMKILEIPTLITQQYPKGLGNTIGEISSVLTENTYVDKTSFDCLQEEAVCNWLDMNKKNNILLAGVESHICVLQTALALKSRGFNPIIVADAVSSRKQMDYEYAMQRFNYEKIMITTIESILFEFVGGSKHEHFKEISKLIK